MNDRFHTAGQYDRRINRKHPDTEPIKDYGRKKFRVPAKRTALRLCLLPELLRAEALPDKEEKENRKTKSYGGIRKPRKIRQEGKNPFKNTYAAAV